VATDPIDRRRFEEVALHEADLRAAALDRAASNCGVGAMTSTPAAQRNALECHYDNLAANEHVLQVSGRGVE